MILFFDIKWRKKAKNGNSTDGRVCCFAVESGVMMEKRRGRDEWGTRLGRGLRKCEVGGEGILIKMEFFREKKHPFGIWGKFDIVGYIGRLLGGWLFGLGAEGCGCGVCGMCEGVRGSAGEAGKIRQRSEIWGDIDISGCWEVSCGDWVRGVWGRGVWGVGCVRE